MVSTLAAHLGADPPAGPSTQFEKPIVSVSFTLKDDRFKRQFERHERVWLERAVACVFITEIGHYYRFLDFTLARAQIPNEEPAMTEPASAPERDRKPEDEQATQIPFHDEIDVVAPDESCWEDSDRKRPETYRLRIELHSDKVFDFKEDREYYFRITIRGTGHLRAPQNEGEREVKLPFRDVKLWRNKVGSPRTLFTEVRNLVRGADYQKRYLRRELGAKLLRRVSLTDHVRILPRREGEKLAWVAGVYDCDLCLDRKSCMGIEHKILREYQGRTELKAEYLGPYRGTGVENRIWKGKLFLEEVGSRPEETKIFREVPPKAKVTGLFVDRYVRLDTVCDNELYPRRPDEAELFNDDESFADYCTCCL